jgi:tetraacyldisaccharide 4'-kinase
MLSLLASIYAKIADVRNRLYELGVFATYDLGARVISIGNITSGGTGKTPLVARVAEILADRGEKVCILTRGYGRENAERRVLVSDGNEVLADVREAGDEPFELANKLIGKALVIADADRVAAAEGAKRRFGVTAFVLDDGFQHRKAKRDVDIVCIDATNPFGGGKMLPAGRLREPMHNLRRAHAIVLTRANLVENIADLRSEISDLAPGVPIFEARNKIGGIIAIDEFQAKPQKGIEIKERVFAFCGIGNPSNFIKSLKAENIEVASSLDFPDHHIYRQEDIAHMEGLAMRNGAKAMITTAKDAVKLSNLKFEIPLYVAEIEVRLDDEAAFAAML